MLIMEARHIQDSMHVEENGWNPIGWVKWVCMNPYIGIRSINFNEIK
jgi:hypothetical protein